MGDLLFVWELVEMVELGWLVNWYSYGFNEFCGYFMVVLKDDKGVIFKNEKKYYLGWFLWFIREELDVGL